MTCTLSRAPTAYRSAGVAVAIAVALCSALLLATGASHQAVFPVDTSAALDLGWQVYTGHRPHVDFYSYLGALHPALLAATMKIFGPSANVLAYLPALLLPILGVAAWRLGRRRLPALPAALYATMTAFLAAGTFCLGMGLRSQGYAMQYNRFGWVVLLLLGLHSLADPYDDLEPREIALDDVIAGVTFGLIVFSKLNYVVVATVLLAIGFVLRRKKSAAGFTVGMLIAVVPIAFFVRFNFVAVVRDIIQTFGTAQHTGVSSAAGILHVVKVSLGQEIALLSALAIAAYAFFRAADRRGALRVIFVTGTLVVGGIAACRGNQQYGDIPTFGLAGLLIGDSIWRRFGQTSLSFVATLIGIAVAFPFPARDLGSVAYSALWHFEHSGTDPRAGRIPATAMQPLGYPAEPGEATNDVVSRILSDSSKEFLTPLQYATWVDDGVALLRPLVDRAPSVFTLDLSNPFPFALGLPEPKRNVFFWSRANWSERFPPAADTILATADIVMIPKRPNATADTRRFLAETFGPGIQRDFRPAGESRLWRVLVRRGGRADSAVGRIATGDSTTAKRSTSTP